MRGGLSTSGRLVRLCGAVRGFLGARRQGGFTIIEVVIVLAVTGALFLSAAVMIAGRQRQTAFTQSSQQIQSQIQQVINEVAAGFFPDTDNFRCSASINGPVFTSVSAGQGTNAGCIFLGKAMQFGVDDSEPDVFSVYTIAGLQKSSGGTEVSSLAEARPMAVAPSTQHPGYPDNSSSDLLQHGLKAVRMWYNNGGADVEIGAVAFINSLAEFGFAGEIVSGSGRVNVVAIDETSLGTSKTKAVDAMNSGAGDNIANGTINPSGGVYICFDGGTDDYALVQIGGDKRELSVTLKTIDKRGTTCQIS